MAAKFSIPTYRVNSIPTSFEPIIITKGNTNSPQPIKRKLILMIDVILIAGKQILKLFN